MLVALRLVIGVHFFLEGLEHVDDPAWSSEGFLRQARGPLADHYRTVLPDFAGWTELMEGKLGNTDVTAWSKSTQEAWEAYRKQIADYDNLQTEQQEIERAVFFWQTEMTDGWNRDSGRFSSIDNLTDEQKEVVKQRVRLRQAELREWVKQNRDALTAHIHDARRLAEWRAADSAYEVPYQKERIAEMAGRLNREAGGWLAQLKDLDRDLQQDLGEVRNDAQKRRRPQSVEPSQLSKIDKVLKYGILAIGGCLIIGLFTRLAAFLGAVFLASVALAQPMWLPDAAPTYPQILEMVALLALATTPVGRWGGVDFLIHSLFGRCCSTKGRLTCT